MTIILLAPALLVGCLDDVDDTAPSGMSSSMGPGRRAQAGGNGAPSGAGHGQGHGNGGEAACGNGVTNPMEGCDDGNDVDGDGCSAACVIEAGYTCAGKRSLCFTTCGDGIVAGAEACDDGNTSAGEGCDASCGVETGYACSGSPSVCAPVCGDGLILGAEVCDDGNSGAGDGCDAGCDIEAGHSCTGVPSVCTPGCGDGEVAGSEGCDDGNTKSGDGCDDVCRIEPGFTCTGTRSLCCIPEVEPNETYDFAGIPLPVDAFGCGSIFPLGDSDYFSFMLPVASDVVIKTYNEQGGDVFFCEDTFLDLFGPDGQTLIASNDDNGLFTYTGNAQCSAIAPATHPSAHDLPAGTYYVKVTHTNNGNVIPAYAIKIDAIVCGDGVIEGDEQCDGGPSCDASCLATVPGPGESKLTAEPFPGCPTAPSSTLRLDVPSCFPPSGPIQWYSHVATDEVLAVSANAPGPVALFNAAGQELRCSWDTTQAPVATFSGDNKISGAGDVFYIAVSLPSAMTCLDFNEHSYTGLGGPQSPPPASLNITFPATGTTINPLITTNTGGMAASPTQVFIGTARTIHEVLKTGNMAPIIHGSAQGFTITTVGSDMYFLNGTLFGLDNAFQPSATRLYRYFDGATWGPTAWEAVPAVYPNNFVASHAFAFDGTSFISATLGAVNGFQFSVRFFAYSSSVQGQPYQELATIPPMNLGIANGIAADSQYLYVTGNSWRLPGIGPQKDGIYRFDRANLQAPPVQLASYGVYPSLPGIHRALYLDDLANPRFLYGRDNNGDIHVVIDPAGAAEHVGTISTLGGPNDRAMTYDQFDHVIYFFESESDPKGQIVKLQ